MKKILEFVDVKMDERLYKILKRWSEERKEDMKEGRNACTREPIYKVQSRDWVHCTEHDYDRTELVIDCESFFTLEDIKNGEMFEFIYERVLDEKVAESISKDIKQAYSLEEVVEILEASYIDILGESYYIVYLKEVWKDKAYFLTRREAEEYRVYQKHNLGKSRVYVDYPGYANEGSLTQFLSLLDYNEIFR